MSDAPQPRDSVEDAFPAYERAWKVRRSAGDSSVEVLLREFAAIGYDPDDEERSFWTGAWSEGVRPRRLGRHLLKHGVRELSSMAKEIRSILVEPDWPEWMLPPPGYRPLSAGFVSADVKKRLLEFTPDLSAGSTETILRCRQLRERRSGFRKVRVWLHPRHQPGRVPVMFGEHRIGWTALHRGQVTRLRRKPWSRTTKVADGTLQLRFGPAGAVTFGKLRVHLPPAD